jgi:Domain of unknown function (DUF5666)
MRRFKFAFAFCTLLVFAASTALRAQEPSAPDSGAPQQHQGRGGEGGPRPTFGKITAIHNGSFDISTPDGQTLTVKLNDQTEFRRDRQPAALSDFKVGDVVAVRGEENSDHTITARMIGERTGGFGAPGGGPSGPGGPGGAAMGTLGKDYVVGEVKAINAPRLTILRSDNVTQTIELNEETSLRKGRESVTLAEIQVGDHIMARGASPNDVFVPKGVMVMSAEQWRRMQEMRGGNAGAAPAPQVKPSEPPN